MDKKVFRNGYMNSIEQSLPYSIDSIETSINKLYPEKSTFSIPVTTISSNIIQTACPWPIRTFTSQYKGKDFVSVNKPSRCIRKFYKTQDSLIKLFERIHDGECDNNDGAKMQNQRVDMSRKQAMIYSKLSFFFNLILVILKVYVFAISGSMSIISSLLDSSIDLVSGIVTWISLKLVRKRDPMRYPQGRTRLEPISVIIICTIMSVTSVEIIMRSIYRIVLYSKGKGSDVLLNTSLIVLMSVTVSVKFVMTLIGTLMKNSFIRAVVVDNRNDVFSNTFTLIFGAMGAKLSKFYDPIGAIIMSLSITCIWTRLLITSVRSIVGHAANPQFIQLISFICLNHSPHILYLESVRAFHIGTNHFVEVDIVLAETMQLKQAHDIGESLQRKLENLTEVERAFVHLDYNFSHEPTTEHKIV